MLDGVYVLDLNIDKVVVVGASSYSESRFAAHALLRDYKVPTSTVDMEDSYHFYPLQKGETRAAAEQRIVEQMIQKLGRSYVIARPNVMEKASISSEGLATKITRTEGDKEADTSELSEVFDISL